MSAPENARQVAEDWILYDTMRIGAKAVLEKYPGAVADWAGLAGLEGVSFFNERNVSNAGKAYTNVTSESKIPWPFKVESIGCEFHCPNPAAASSPQLGAVSKIFGGLVSDHSWFDFYLREDIRLTLKPKMAAPGYGLVGFAEAQLAIPTTTNETFGLQNAGNRFRWTEAPLDIPVDTPIRVDLAFHDYARNILIGLAAEGLTAQLHTVTESLLDAQIRFSLRGKRFVQQRGELFSS